MTKLKSLSLRLMSWSLRHTGRNLETVEKKMTRHVEFARTNEQLFDRWCSSKKVGSDHAKLRQLMLVEEFKRCINSDVKAFLNEREVENLETAARLADDYALTHKASFVNKPYPRKPYNPQSKQITPQSKPYSSQSGPKANPSNPTDNSSPKPKFSSENKGQNPLSQPICNYCKTNWPHYF